MTNMTDRKKRRLSEKEAAQYGFRWNQIDVVRYLETPRGHVALGVESDFGKVEIVVSKTGRSIRVFKNGVELKEPA